MQVIGEMNTTELNLPKPTPNILMALPDYDFDPMESTIHWKECVSRGWRVAFSTAHGSVAQADLNKLTGPLPGLLRASEIAETAYQEMTQYSDYYTQSLSLRLIPSNIWLYFFPAVTLHTYGSTWKVKYYKAKSFSFGSTTG